MDTSGCRWLARSNLAVTAATGVTYLEAAAAVSRRRSRQYPRDGLRQAARCESSGAGGQGSTGAARAAEDIKCDRKTNPAQAFLTQCRPSETPVAAVSADGRTKRKTLRLTDVLGEQVFSYTYARLDNVNLADIDLTASTVTVSDSKGVVASRGSLPTAPSASRVFPRPITRPSPSTRTAAIAKELRVSERSVERWRRAWRGWEDQRWTLARVQTVIDRRFRVSLSVAGVWRLLRRHGWSWQSPARRALERNEDAVELWKKEVWPLVEAPRRRSGPGSSSNCAVRRAKLTADKLQALAALGLEWAAKEGAA